MQFLETSHLKQSVKKSEAAVLYGEVSYNTSSDGI